jgi:hypothetical protein
MHFSNFENLKLNFGDRIIIVNAQGEALHGIFRGSYSRSEGMFDFLNFNGSRVDRINLLSIQHINKN